MMKLTAEVESAEPDEQEFESIDDQQDGDDQPGENQPADNEPEQSADAGRPAILDEIARAEQECVDAEEVVERCKAELKEAKATYDLCVVKLRHLAAACRNDANRPLFAGQDSTADADELPDSDGDQEVGEDDWRNATIADLALSDALTNRLDEHGIYTVGDLEDLRARIADGRAKWPKGIGEAKITTIEDAVIDWLAAWNNRQPAEQEATSGENTDAGE